MLLKLDFRQMRYHFNLILFKKTVVNYKYETLFKFFLDINWYVLYIMYVMYINKREEKMTTTISTADARKTFADIVNKVAYGIESVVLTRRGKEVAALISIEELELLQQIEDYIDIEDAKKALSDPGRNIPAQDVWKHLGI